MWTRGMLILVACLMASNVRAVDIPSGAATHRPARARNTVHVVSDEAEPILAPLPSPPIHIPMHGEAVAAAAGHTSPGPGDSCPTECADCQRLPRPWCDYCLSPCDFVQHLAYPPACHGWYYFRPYNVGQVEQLQRAVIGWGGDPRNPYSNEIFQRVYPKNVSKPPEDAQREPIVEAPQREAMLKWLERLGHQVSAEIETPGDSAGSE